MKSYLDTEARYFLTVNLNFNFEKSKQKQIISTKLLIVIGSANATVFLLDLKLLTFNNIRRIFTPI